MLPFPACLTAASDVSKFIVKHYVQHIALQNNLENEASNSQHLMKTTDIKFSNALCGMVLLSIG